MDPKIIHEINRLEHDYCAGCKRLEGISDSKKRLHICSTKCDAGKKLNRLGEALGGSALDEDDVKKEENNLQETAKGEKHLQEIASSIEILLDAGHVQAAKKLAATLEHLPIEGTKNIKERDFKKEFKLYMRMKELSKNTQQNYIDALNDFLADNTEFTKDNLVEWKQKLIDTKAPKTVEGRVIAMNQFIKNILKDEELMLKPVRVPQQTYVENVISIDEFDKLSEFLIEKNNKRAYWIVQFLGRTGARVGELVRFRKSDLKRGFAQMNTKGRIRVIHIPTNLVKESKGHFDLIGSEWLFPNLRDSQKHITSRGIAEIIKSNGLKCGIRGNVLYAHSFRHLFAIEFLKRNPDISLLADLLGHSNVATTQIYTRLSKEQQRRQLNKTIDW